MKTKKEKVNKVLGQSIEAETNTLMDYLDEIGCVAEFDKTWSNLHHLQKINKALSNAIGMLSHK